MCNSGSILRKARKLKHQKHTIFTQEQYMFFGNQAQILDGLDNSREQKYTGTTVITIYWVYIQYFIITVIQ
jgi:hypothetical protein